MDCLTFSDDATQLQVLEGYEGTSVERHIVPSFAVCDHSSHLDVTAYIHLCVSDIRSKVELIEFAHSVWNFTWLFVANMFADPTLSSMYTHTPA